MMQSKSFRFSSLRHGKLKGGCHLSFAKTYIYHPFHTTKTLLCTYRCAHCRSMAEDWSRLGEDFEGHEYTVVGEVDCTSDEGKPLCDEFEVEVSRIMKYLKSK
jgi:hypothetical protein